MVNMNLLGRSSLVVICLSSLWACLAQAGVTYVQTLDGIHMSRTTQALGGQHGVVDLGGLSRGGVCDRAASSWIGQPTACARPISTSSPSPPTWGS
jgi:hypothetical protein